MSVHRSRAMPVLLLVKCVLVSLPGFSCAYCRKMLDDLILARCNNKTGTHEGDFIVKGIRFRVRFRLKVRVEIKRQIDWTLAGGSGWCWHRFCDRWDVPLRRHHRNHSSDISTQETACAATETSIRVPRIRDPRKGSLASGSSCGPYRADVANSSRDPEYVVFDDDEPDCHQY